MICVVLFYERKVHGLENNTLFFLFYAPVHDITLKVLVHNLFFLVSSNRWNFLREEMCISQICISTPNLGLIIPDTYF